MRANKLSRAVLAWATALSVGSLLFVQGQETVRSAGRRLGFLPVQGARGVYVDAVYPGGPADRGGLRAGDEILVAGGWRVGGMLDYGDAARRFEHGRPVRLLVARAGRTLDVTVVPTNKPTLRELHDRARTISRGFAEISYEWVPRAQNSERATASSAGYLHIDLRPPARITARMTDERTMTIPR